MALFRKKRDPIAERERALNSRIATLQGEIQQLRHRISVEQSQPKLRSTAVPHQAAAPPTDSPANEPAFEEVNHQRVQQPAEIDNTPSHYNHLGVRKYDLVTTARRWLNQLRGQPTATNHKLVNYLAAGSIHGLRPLRYEKRIARNRFLVVCGFFLVILWGLIYWYYRNR